MSVHFIGAGPGAADLITLRGRDLIAACPVCLYAGSLVPEALLAHCPDGARIVNTAPLSLDEIMAEIRAAHAAGQDVARLHSGDLSVWSAMGEQLRRLRAENIPYDATLAIHLSVHVLENVVEQLTPHYGADCPVAVIWRATWPDQRIVKATLATLEEATGGERGRTALILVGRALGAEEFDESCLYAGDYDRRFRPVGTSPRFPEDAS